MEGLTLSEPAFLQFDEDATQALVNKDSAQWPQPVSLQLLEEMADGAAFAANESPFGSYIAVGILGPRIIVGVVEERAGDVFQLDLEALLNLFCSLE